MLALKHSIRHYVNGRTTTRWSTFVHMIKENIVKNSEAKNETIFWLNVSEIADFIENNCYNRETIGLHHPSMNKI